MPYRSVTFTTHIEDEQVEVSASIFLSDSDPGLINAYVEELNVYLSAPPGEEVDFDALPPDVKSRIYRETLERS